MNQTSSIVRDPLLGRLINGRFRLEAAIGRGGMGAVYLANQEAIGRHVAMKILRPDLASDPTLAERFEYEARAATRLVHPHVVTVHDFGRTDDGACYLVMEHIVGESLRSRLDREGAQSPQSTLLIAEQVCDALAAAQAAGLLHRDLKPDNLMLTRVGDREDFVKVLDFGIAKLVEATHVKTHTIEGTLVGTPQYMAPEYVRGGPYDHRADLFAVGVIMYEMLVGGHPFANENPASAMLLQLQGFPRLPADTEGEVAAIVNRATALSPDDRFASAMEMRDQIRQARKNAGELPMDAFATRGPLQVAILEGMPTLLPMQAPAKAVPVSQAPSPTELFAVASMEGRAAAATTRPTRSKGRYALFGAGALALVALAVFWLASSGSTAVAPRVTPAPDPTPVAATPAAAAQRPVVASSPRKEIPRAATALAPRVTLKLRSQPEGASVFVDGELRGDTPLDELRERRDQRLSVRFELDGYVSRTLDVMPDRERTVSVALAPARAPRARRVKVVEREGDDEAPPSPRVVREPEASPTKARTRPPTAQPAEEARPSPVAPRPASPKRKVHDMEFEP